MQYRIDWSTALLVRAFSIHAGGKEVAILLLQRRGWMIRRFLEIQIQQILVTLIELIEAAPSRLIRGDGIIFDPVAAGKLVEVIAWIDAGVERLQIKAMQGFGFGRYCGVVRWKRLLRHGQSRA